MCTNFEHVIGKMKNFKPDLNAIADWENSIATSVLINSGNKAISSHLESVLTLCCDYI